MVTYIDKSSTNNEALTGAETDSTMLLMATAKHVTLRTLPWGTPSSNSYDDEIVLPTLTLMNLSFKNHWVAPSSRLH